MRALEWFLIILVLAGALPPLAGCYQFLLAGLHVFRHDPAGVAASQSWTRPDSANEARYRIECSSERLSWPPDACSGRDSECAHQRSARLWFHPRSEPPAPFRFRVGAETAPAP